MSVLVEAAGLAYTYGRARTPYARAIEHVDLTVVESSSLGIVGETGSGKSTLIRLLCGLVPMQRGELRYEGREVREWLRLHRTEFRRRNQMVFQSPANAFDPRMRLGAAVAEPTKSLARKAPTRDELAGWFQEVGLSASLLARYPHEVSGGQLQRAAIARALSVSPQVLYADEPTSALDVSVQAQVLNLLQDLRSRRGLTLVMVSHDLAVISRVCDNVIVLRDGQIIEAGTTRQVLTAPASDYARSLVEAARAVSASIG